MLTSILDTIFEVLILYFALSVAYLFIFSVMGKWGYRKKELLKTEPVNRIAILVPAYREDGIILSTARNLLQLNYPQHLYDIYLIADSFDQKTLQQLRALPLQVMEVTFERSTKAKSLNEAFRQITKPYSIALICDADNMLANDFLIRLDQAFGNGIRAVQGRRVAKNLDTSFAILDACSEAINNNIFRRGANALGLSSAVIGSGMAFEFEKLKEVLSEIDAVGGFDKPLQLKVVQQGIRIEYLEDALVFDEKVENSKAFRQQRKRWMSSQFIYLKQYFLPSLKQLLRGNLSYFNLAFANNIILPRAIMLLMLPLLVLVSYFVEPHWSTYFVWLFGIYLLSLLVSLPAVLVNRNLLVAMLQLPRAIGGMVLSFINMRKANKTFIHTVHTKTEVSNNLFKEHGN